MSTERGWIIQSLRGNRYVNETQPTEPLTRSEMLKKLTWFERKFPHLEFRGHHWVNVEAHGGEHYELHRQRL